MLDYSHLARYLCFPFLILLYNTTYPFLLQSRPNLTNFLLILIGIILILITSPAAILNLSKNLFCPLDTALVLTSDNFNSIFPPPLFLFRTHPGASYPKLSHGTIFNVSSHTFTLFRFRETSVIVETSVKLPFVYVRLYPEISSFFT